MRWKEKREEEEGRERSLLRNTQWNRVRMVLTCNHSLTNVSSHLRCLKEWVGLS